jgi:outer membrane protein assembly factor BamB
LLSAGPQLWAAGYGMGATAKLFLVDPATGMGVAEVSAGQVCCDLAAGAGRIWAIDPRGDLLGVDPDRHRITERYGVPFDPDVHTNAVFGAGSVWVGSDGMALSQIDPATGAIERTIHTGGGPPFLVHGGLVWGAAPDLIWAVDPGTGDVVRSIPLDDSMEVISLGIGLGSIWAGIRHPGYIGAVLQLDASTGRVVTDLPDVDIPARIAIGFGSVWVSDSGSSSVYRIAPA